MASAMASCGCAITALHRSSASRHSPKAWVAVTGFQLRSQDAISFNPCRSGNELVSKKWHPGCGIRVGGGGVGRVAGAEGLLVVAARAGRLVAAAAAGSPTLPEALLFDCDGVLVDTERDGHRISFNIAFSEKGFDSVDWDVDLYGELLKIGGGKERMTHYFNKYGWPEAAPSDVPGRKDLVVALHKRKTDIFMDLVEKGSLPLRPGVARLVDEALDNGVNVAVCSTSNEKAVSAIVRIMLGPERASKILIFAGDVVPRKKPHPAIYLLAAKTLKVAPERCVVVEDSHIGLTAAKAAGMKCIVTKSGYTEEENFAAADAVFGCIGDPPTANFDLGFAASLLSLPADAVA